MQSSPAKVTPKNEILCDLWGACAQIIRKNGRYPPDLRMMKHLTHAVPQLDFDRHS